MGHPPSHASGGSHWKAEKGLGFGEPTIVFWADHSEVKHKVEHVIIQLFNPQHLLQVVSKTKSVNIYHRMLNQPSLQHCWVLRLVVTIIYRVDYTSLASPNLLRSSKTTIWAHKFILRGYLIFFKAANHKQGSFKKGKNSFVWSLWRGEADTGSHSPETSQSNVQVIGDRRRWAPPANVITL